MPILLATVWISLSEFVRNEVLLKSYWTGHYENLGIIFPSAPVNGAVWGLWSFLCAVAVFIISRKFNLIQTTLLSWFVAFVLMWVVIGNLGILIVANRRSAQPARSLRRRMDYHKTVPMKSRISKTGIPLQQIPIINSIILQLNIDQLQNGLSGRGIIASMPNHGIAASAC